MTQASFTIPGRIGPKGRPRAVMVGGRARLYTPKATRSNEGIARHFASEAMYGLKPFEGPVEVSIVIFQRTPASWSKKRAAASVWITGRPDLDNVLKLIADSMNGIVYLDDAQIAKVSIAREYANWIPEQVQVTVTELADAQAETRAA